MLVSLGSVAVLAANTTSKKSSGSSYVSFLFLILIVGAVVLMMRRGRSRQKAVIEARSNVAPGVEVVTTAGLIATVIDGDDETVTLEIAPGVHSKFLRQAIARVVVPPSEEATETETEAPETTDAPDDNPPEGTH
ncbi:MAG TPA: preprotein translocase subunit YajC [Mycobacteriales bacterium]|nr:preprotein translocase subunit YajC [Mycobacteriales bacterium]